MASIDICNTCRGVRIYIDEYSSFCHNASRLGGGWIQALQWNVSQLLKSAVGSEREYEIDEPPFQELAAPIVGTARLMRTPEGILVTADLRTALSSVCSRCLERFTTPLAFTLVEQFYPTLDINTGVRLEKPDDSFALDAQHILDLDEPVRQYALLRIPIKPLCKEDCLGLCPSCGTNLNQQSCNCSQEHSDDRWEALKALRGKLRA